MAAPAATFALQYLDATNPSYIQRVTMAMVLAATQIASESTGTADHANRVLLVRSILGNPESWGQQFAFACATQVAATDMTDADLSTAVSSVWNGIAGAL